MICPKCGGNILPQDDLLVCQSCGAKFVKKAQTSQPEHSASDARQNEEVQNLKSRIADMEQKQAAMEVELAKAKKASQTNGALGAGKSGFTATVFELFAERLLLMWVSMVTLGFAYPWLKCHYERFIASKTYVKGRRLSFDGKGKDLAKKYYLWMLLCVVTFGIYSIFLADKLHKWVIEHTHYDGNEGGESSYDGKTGVIFGFKLASFFAGAFTLGLAKPFVECKREDYLCEHTIIDDSHLYFDGTGSGLLKKQVLWVALTIATCGVYAIWLNLQKEQWFCANKSNDSVDLDESVATVLTPEERARIAEEKRLQHEQERAQHALERQQKKERFKEMKKTPQGKLSTALFAVAVVLFAVAFALMIAMLVEGSYAWFEPSSKALIAFEVIFSVATAAMMTGCIVCSKKIQRTALAIAAIVLIVCSVGTMSAGFYGSSQAVKYSNVDPFFYELLDDGTYRVSFNYYNDSVNDDDYQMQDAKKYGIVRLEGNLVIPSSYKGIPVTSIGDLWKWFVNNSYYASDIGASESNDKITSITIPDSIKTIKDGAFEGMSGITEITIPASVENVGYGAFRNCTNLTTVYWNSSAEIENNNGIFSGCTKLTNIIVGENVTRVPQTIYNEEWFNNQPDGLVIANNYVYGYKGMMSTDYALIIPNGTIGIMDNAFEIGNFISSVYIPDSVTYIGANAFSGCSRLKNITASANAAIKISKQCGSNVLDEIVITSGTKIDGGSSWDGGVFPSSITKITIPDSVTSIGEYTFYGCKNIEEVHVESLEDWCAIDFGYYGSPLCSYSAKLYIGGEVPRGNYIIPDGITTIPMYTFRNCADLTSITIPGSVTSIGDAAFENCTSLTNVTIPDSVTRIEYHAFAGCTSLASVTIPDSVTYTSDFAFENCKGLTLITGSADNVSAVAEHANATAFAANITSGTSIDSYAFNNCSGLTRVTIPSSVTSISYCAFDGCTNLQTVYYGGTKSQWNNISIGSGNSGLKYATRVYIDGTKENTETGTSFDDAITLLPGCRYTVNITTGGQVVYFKFVPTISGSYCIESSMGYPGKQGTLYDSSRSYLRSDNGYKYGSNYYFSIQYSLTAGNTYYVAVQFNSSSTTGSFTVQFS